LSDRRAFFAINSVPKFVLLVGVCILALAVAGACVQPARVTLQTVRLLPALFGADTPLPLSIGSDEITKDSIGVGGAYPGAEIVLYRPVSGRHPALLITLGIDPASADDPRVVRLLSGLARNGIVAGLVTSPNLNQGRLTADAADLLVMAYNDVANQPGVLPDHVGLVGLSAGGSLALIAAADPRIADKVRFVEAVGAYDSLTSLARSVVTRTQVQGGRVIPWQPTPLAQEAVQSNIAELLPPAAVAALLASTDVQSFNAALASLSQSQRAQLDALSPSTFLNVIRAPVFLMVDRSDTFVPPAESMSIAASLEQAGHSLYFSSFDILQHVEPGSAYPPLTLAGDGLRLISHVRALLDRL
jgi:acetyl esterase/lipase